MELIHIINIVFLLYAAVFDIFYNRKVNDSLFVLWFVIGGIVSAFTLGGLPGLIPAIIVLFIGLLIKDIGTGDIFGIAIVTLFSFHIINPIHWVGISFLLSLLFVLVNTFHKWAEDKYGFRSFLDYIEEPYPFFPFLLIGYIIIVIA